MCKFTPPHRAAGQNTAVSRVVAPPGYKSAATTATTTTTTTTISIPPKCTGNPTTLRLLGMPHVSPPDSFYVDCWGTLCIRNREQLPKDYYGTATATAQTATATITATATAAHGGSKKKKVVGGQKGCVTAATQAAVKESIKASLALLPPAASHGSTAKHAAKQRVTPRISTRINPAAAAAEAARVAKDRAGSTGFAIQTAVAAIDSAANAASAGEAAKTSGAAKVSATPSLPTLTRAGFGATASHYARISFENGDGGCIELDPQGLYPHATELMLPQIVAHGQDGRAYLEDAASGFAVTALADGHGPRGELWSRYALLLLPCKILESAASILAAAAEEDSDAIAATMDAAFHLVDHHLRTECAYTKDCKGGGSTMTVSVKFPHPTIPGAVGSITSNVGDSPLVRVSLPVDAAAAPDEPAQALETPWSRDWIDDGFGDPDAEDAEPDTATSSDDGSSCSGDDAELKFNIDFDFDFDFDIDGQSNVGDYSCGWDDGELCSSAPSSMDDGAKSNPLYESDDEGDHRSDADNASDPNASTASGIVELTGDLNAESPHGYARYVQVALEMGYTPANAILGRVNINPKEPERPDITDDDGFPAPIQIFEYTVQTDNDDHISAIEVVPCTEKLREFYEGPLANVGASGVGIRIGGPQTRALRERFIEARERGEFPYFNWGCTLDGSVQPVSSFGDATLHNGEVMPVDTFYEVLRSDCQAGGAAETTKNVVVEVLGSDGFFDVLTHAEIDEAVLKGQQKAAAESGVGYSNPANLAGCILDALWSKMMEVVDTLQKGCDPFTTVDNVAFGIVGMKDNVPSWDDVSIFVTIVEFL